MFGLNLALVLGASGLTLAACGADDRNFKVTEEGGLAGAESAAGAGGSGPTGNGDQGGNGANAGDGGGSHTGGSDTGGKGPGGGGGAGAASPVEIVLLEDDFEENTASWTFIEDGEAKIATVPKGEWSYSDGALVQSSNYVGCPVGKPECPVLDEVPCYALFNRESAREWTDYTVTASFVSFDDDNVGLIARYVDEDNYLLFEMNGAVGAQAVPGYARLRAVQNGVWTELVLDAEPVATYLISTTSALHPATLKLTVVGNEYTAYLDGARLLTYTDNSSEAPARGGVGLTATASVGVHFEHFKVIEE